MPRPYPNPYAPATPPPVRLTDHLLGIVRACNAWLMAPIVDDTAEAEDDDRHALCTACNGSGEGRADGTRCWECNGHGELGHGRSADDLEREADAAFDRAKDERAERIHGDNHAR